MSINAAEKAATLISEEGCTFEFRDGMFYAFEHGSPHNLAMRPSAFMQTFARMAEMLHEYRLWQGDQRPTAEIIEVDFNSKFERVYPRDKPL